VTRLFDRKRGPAVARTVYFGLPLPDAAWAPTKQGAKQLKAGTPADSIERSVGKKAATGWEYPSNQVSPTGSERCPS
jgi:hypothetical protein